MSDETKLSDEQELAYPEQRTAGEVEATEKMRKEAAENAKRPEAVPAPKPESKEDETPQKEKVLDSDK